MEAVIGLLNTVLLIAVLVVVHEFGHFIAARRAGVRVEKFSIGFGPVLFKKQGKQTAFLICLIPLGGYVKMAGDERQQCQGAADEFFSKPVFTRMAIVFAGPLCNYILAFLLFWFIAFWGFSSPQPVVGSLIDEFPAKEAGILAGDRILAVDEVRVETWEQMAGIIYEKSGTVRLTVEREGTTKVIASGLKPEERPDELGRKKQISLIGISPEIIKYDVFGSFIEAGHSLFLQTNRFFKGIYAIVARIVPFRSAAMGPLGIYFLTTKFSQAGILAVLFLMAILSLSLALINLFPVPVLDGGHLMLFLIEKIRKKQLSQRSEEFLTRLGMALLGMLFIFVFYNDIRRGNPFGDKKEAAETSEETVPEQSPAGNE